jgi:phosphoribosylglycinamide formyltransferase-1
MVIQADFNAQSLISPPLSTAQPSGKRVRLGVLASGSGSNYEAMAEAIAKGQLNGEIVVLVYNNPKAKVLKRAQHYQTPTVLHNHRDYQQREDLDSAIVETLQAYEVDWVIMAGWMRIVTSVLINAYPERMINIHPSLLPSFKGIRAVEQALAAKVKITGCTVHKVALAVDSGEIIMQSAVPILPDDTPETLHARIQVQEHKILPQAVALAIG